MYDCARCGASFSPLRISSPETCPRCLAREGVRAPLSYSLFGEVGKSQSVHPRVNPAFLAEAGAPQDDARASS